LCLALVARGYRYGRSCTGEAARHAQADAAVAAGHDRDASAKIKWIHVQLPPLSWALPAFSGTPPHAIVPVRSRTSGEIGGMSATKILKVRVDRERCQGHARCFALAPELFELDQFGNGRERGDGTVPTALEDKARLAQANCPEMAVEIIEE
jgi:ferredoxin